MSLCTAGLHLLSRAHLQWHPLLLHVGVTWTPATAKCIHKVTEEESKAKGSHQGLTLGLILPPYLDRFPDFLHCHVITTAQIYPHFPTVLKAVVLLQSVFQTVLFSAQGFLKGSCDEVLWSDVIKHPKATERIKRMSSKPFHYWKVGIFPGTLSPDAFRIVIDVPTEGTSFPPSESPLPGAML